MNSILLKSICLVLLLLISIAAGFLPLKLKNIRESIATGLACFCGGLLLGICFLDFLPSVRQNHNNPVISGSYPIMELLIMTGFLLVMSLDKIADVLGNQLQIPKSANCEERQAGKHNHVTTRDYKAIDHYDERSPLIPNQPPSHTTESVIIVASGKQLVQRRETSADCPKQGRINCCKLWLISHITGPTLRSIALVIAVAVHSVLEGMVIGLESRERELLQLTALITFHKTLVIFSIGITLTDRKIGLCLYSKEIIFVCLASPAGGLIGMMVTSLDSDVGNSAAAMVLKCLAAGTFLFVAFFEILAKKMVVEKAKDLLNVLFCIIGFSCFAAIAAIPSVNDRQ